MKTTLIGLCGVLAWAILWMAAAAALQGCSSQSGWRVSFGVSPVAAINEMQQTADRRK